MIWRRTWIVLRIIKMRERRTTDPNRKTGVDYIKEIFNGSEELKRAMKEAREHDDDDDDE